MSKAHEGEVEGGGCSGFQGPSGYEGPSQARCRQTGCEVNTEKRGTRFRRFLLSVSTCIKAQSDIFECNNHSLKMQAGLRGARVVA